MQVTKQEAENLFYGFDAGWRQGMFDRCNNQPHRYGDWSGYNIIDNAFNINYYHGYEDAWETYKPKI